MKKNKKSKITNQNCISKFKNFTFWFFILVFNICILNFLLCNSGYAKEITILYTGETHAMLYHCNCPKEPDGGVARRATLINRLRKENPDTLVLDSGGFFAGGVLDQYTQNTQLDRERTIINLKAMALMKYDALTVGDEEFNFGREFLEEKITDTNLAFLSCNISAKNRGGSANNSGGKSDKILPYIIKEVGGIKVGIMGVTTLSAMQKASGLNFVEPKIAIQQTIKELKKNKADIIVLLSHLGETEDLRLINDVADIDILITGHALGREEKSLGKVGNTIILRPSWQGRRLGKLSLTITDKKITDYKVEEPRLSEEIPNDTTILSILPDCFSDFNCNKKDFIGVCQNPATLQSRCVFSEPPKISLLIITPKLCTVCDVERIIKYLKMHFPGLVVSYLYYPSPKADKLIKDFNIKALPVYLLGKEVEKVKGFDASKENLEKKADYYMLKTQFSGISYFLNRERINGKLDLFISLYNKNIKQLLEAAKELNPTIHFLTTEQANRFDAANGNLEIEEYLRSVCVAKYYPQAFWDYIMCRAKNINSSWWGDCLPAMDTDKIKICAQGDEGKLLLKDNISINKELQIMFGPTYLLDNQEIFGIEGVPTTEMLKKILKK
jgi:5'-nucleotidase